MKAEVVLRSIRVYERTTGCLHAHLCRALSFPSSLSRSIASLTACKVAVLKGKKVRGQSFANELLRSDIGPRSYSIVTPDSHQSVSTNLQNHIAQQTLVNMSHLDDSRKCRVCYDFRMRDLSSPEQSTLIDADALIAAAIGGCASCGVIKLLVSKYHTWTDVRQIVVSYEYNGTVWYIRAWDGQDEMFPGYCIRLFTHEGHDSMSNFHVLFSLAC